MLNLQRQGITQRRKARKEYVGYGLTLGLSPFCDKLPRCSGFDYEL
jgi:hypothetical protein